MRGKTLAVNQAGKEMAAVIRILNVAWYRPRLVQGVLFKIFKLAL